MKIAARKKDWPADKPSIEVEFNMPATLQEKVAAFGEDVVNGKAEDSIVIDVQALIRRKLDAKDEKDRTQEAIQKAVAEYKPSSSTRVVRSAAEKVEDLAGKMSAEEKKALIAKLKEDLKAAG